MANVVIQIRVGKSEANKAGREYRLSLGYDDSKIDNGVLFDQIEEAMEDKLTKIYGYASPIRGEGK